MAETPNATIRLPLLFGGMSNQPAHIRSLNQVAKAENAVFSVVDGASKRPGTQWIAEVGTLPDAGEDSTFSGSIVVPPEVVPNPTGPDQTGTGTDGTAGQSGETSSTCQPAAYASSYLLTGLNVEVYSVVPALENGPLLDTFGSNITITQKANQCVWCGTATSTHLTITACVALRTGGNPVRWDLTMLATVTAETDPSTDPTEQAAAAKAGSSPIVTSWNFHFGSSGIGEYGFIFNGPVTIS
jgi:hypothetical protein